MKKEETKKEKEIDYSIEAKDQSHLKTISKIFYIVAKIWKVFVIIGMVGVFIGMVCIPLLMANIKVTKEDEKRYFNIFGTEFYLNRTPDSFEIYEKGKETDKQEINEKSEVEAIDEVLRYLDKHDLKLMTVFVEIELALTIVLLFIEIKILKKVYLFFKNIHDKTTPFTNDNTDLLKGIAKLSIYSIIISVTSSIIASSVFDTSFSVSLNDIAKILLIFVAVYVFEYGTKLQTETKGEIYSKDE